MRTIQGMMKQWVFGTGPICPCPLSHRDIGPGPGQARQSPAGHGQLTHQGLDGEMQDALIKLMLFVDFLLHGCQHRSVPKGCESRFLSGEPWTLATGVLYEGRVLS